MSVLRLPFLERGKNETVADLFHDELQCEVPMLGRKYTPEERVAFAIFLDDFGEFSFEFVA